MNRTIAALLLMLSLGSAVVATLRSQRGVQSRLALVVLGSLVAAAMIAGIGVARQAALTDPHPAARGELGVLVWNTGQDDVPSSRIVQTDADVVVLPEYFETVAHAQLGEWASSHGYQIYSAQSVTASVLITDDLGPYHVDTDGAPPWAGFVARPENPGSPTIIAVHAERTGWVDASLWNEHLDWAQSECDDTTILAGDLNAPAQALQDGSLGDCADASVSLGATSPGSWPTMVPPGLGAQIDRVLSGAGWRPTRFDVLSGYDGDGTDHRPVFTALQKMGPAE